MAKRPAPPWADIGRRLMATVLTPRETRDEHDAPRYVVLACCELLDRPHVARFS